MEILKAAKELIATVAPTVASAFGGPLAGVAVRKLLPILGLSDDASENEVNTAIQNATPEQLIALKKLDQEFKVQMKQLDIDLAKITTSDKDSARKREIETKDYTPRIRAYIICGLYVGVQYFLFTHVVDPSMREMIMRALGTLDAILGLVFSYYFGSSIGELTNKSKEPKE